MQIWIFLLFTLSFDIHALGTLNPLPEETSCSTTSDCVVAANSCNFCCGQVAINKKFKTSFSGKVAECTKKWVGAMCDCAFALVETECVKSKCQLKKLAPRKN